ncbi:MAG: GNAT family N-acetyltransferase [Acetobacteraceae bacterium]
MSTVFEIPTLATERLILRAFRPRDLDGLAAMNADVEVRRWLGGRLLSRQESWSVMETALGQWALRGYGLFAVEHEGRFAGRVGILHPADWTEPELAWGLGSAFWGKGLATEAAAAVRDWAFDTFGFPELASFILTENVRSRRVAEKLGGVCQDKVEIRGLVADRWVHPRPGRGVMA